MKGAVGINKRDSPVDANRSRRCSELRREQGGAQVACTSRRIEGEGSRQRPIRCASSLLMPATAKATSRRTVSAKSRSAGQRAAHARPAALERACMRSQAGRTPSARRLGGHRHPADMSHSGDRAGRVVQAARQAPRVDELVRTICEALRLDRRTGGVRRTSFPACSPQVTIRCGSARAVARPVDGLSFTTVDRATTPALRSNRICRLGARGAIARARYAIVAGRDIGRRAG